MISQINQQLYNNKNQQWRKVEKPHSWECRDIGIWYPKSVHSASTSGKQRRMNNGGNAKQEVIIKIFKMFNVGLCKMWMAF